MHFDHVLMVCTGNICRSPMAEALLRARLGPDRQIAVSSAGTGALAGAPADPQAQALMEARGIDLASHRARQLDRPLLLAAPLVLVMDDSHARWIAQRVPEARGRVQQLGRWRRLDVPDPYRRGPAAFEHALQLIDGCIDDWLQRL
ncbi:MAG: low molecular weight protein-tyrosine-phosphatase [Pseudomonadota bacterium]|nr:low molecular weight protein-tyrosine-phosphatase [Pseudomonadota bacterium]